MRNEMLKYQRLRDMREEMALSQKTIAQYLNITQHTYSRYETNERNIPLEIVGMLADYYHTSVDYLIGRTDEKLPYPKPCRK
jgi:transcriptional regulator with XRE-family HTH domain